VPGVLRENWGKVCVLVRTMPLRVQSEKRYNRKFLAFEVEGKHNSNRWQIEIPGFTKFNGD